jgi:hypothetical protein
MTQEMAKDTYEIWKRFLLISVGATNNQDLSISGTNICWYTCKTISHLSHRPGGSFSVAYGS